MKVQRQRIMAYGILIVLFVVGAICYAAFPGQEPEDPVRIMFKGTAGNVLFDHKEHASENGYGLACDECHHNLEEEGERPEPCSECHIEDDEDIIKRSDAFHKQCIECHKDDGTAPVKCSACHRMK